MSVPSAVTSANNSDSQSPLVETVNVIIQDVRWESVPGSTEEALKSATTLPVVPEPEDGGTEETVLSTTETITIIEITSVPVQHEVEGYAISKVAEESGDQSNDDDGIFDLDELVERGWKKASSARAGPPPPPAVVSGHSPETLQTPPAVSGQTANTSTHNKAATARFMPTAALPKKQGPDNRKQ